MNHLTEHFSTLGQTCPIQWRPLDDRSLVFPTGPKELNAQNSSEFKKEHVKNAFASQSKV